MSGLKDTLKGGWHPKGKDGGTESWRGDYKGINQVAGWVGKGKDTKHTQEAHDHVSRPLSTLKDPSSFGPPPKNVNFHGGAALPNQITPDRSGLGAPLTQEEIEAKRRVEEEEALEREAKERRAAAPKPPFRVDTTGLSTANIPPPPKRRDIMEGSSNEVSSPHIKPKPKPGLPPRLPARQNSNLGLGTVSPPPSYGAATAEPPAHRGILNQGSLNRLGAAGVTVPGFGISGRQPLPPPRQTSAAVQPEAVPRTTSPTKSATSPNGAQLNEIQSRFSRLTASSPGSEAPTQGTSFADKQAALRTASAFRKDPTSVSLSDARSAASTAHNFRERHGDQVATGLKSANSLNQKYGLAEKADRYSNTTDRISSAHTESPKIPNIEMRDNTVASKKAPPPLPKKKPELAATGAGPPPIPLASKPKPKMISSTPEQKDYELDLQSLWFTKSPVIFPPPSVSRLPGSRGTMYTSGWSSSGARRLYFLTGVIRDNQTLIKTKINITWDGNEPGLTVKAQQKHFPPPEPLNTQEREKYRQMYSERVAAWCESKKGQKVGNGECWTLAYEALVATAEECRTDNEEPCLISQSLIHGFLIYTNIPPRSSEPPGGIIAAGVARGDIIQFLSAHLKSKDGTRWNYAGAPDHTAVVTHVEGDGVLRTVEQNTGGVKIVKDGRYDLSEMIGGEARVFRAAGENWLKPLGPTDLSWP